jgi:hypothetical protein
VASIVERPNYNINKINRKAQFKNLKSFIQNTALDISLQIV